MLLFQGNLSMFYKSEDILSIFTTKSTKIFVHLSAKAYYIRDNNPSIILVNINALKSRALIYQAKEIATNRKKCKSRYLQVQNLIMYVYIVYVNLVIRS